MNIFKIKLKKLDFSILIVPFTIIVILSLLFFFYPDETKLFFDNTKPFFSDKMGIIYLSVNLLVFIFSFVLAFSKYGKIKLGDKDEKPLFSFWGYGAMMFCAGLSGSIIYYSFTEWIYYMNEPFIQSFDNPHNLFVNSYNMAQAHSFFFWSNYWLYLVLAVCFGFMMHTRKISKLKFSESLRPLLKNRVDGIIGKTIDIFAVIAIIAAVTCSLCFSPPIITNCLHKLFNFPDNNTTTIIILLLIFAIYSASLYNGLRGIKALSNVCIYVFLIFLIYVFLFGGEMQFILESSFQQLGVMLDNLIPLFTYTDATKKLDFVQNYNIYYDAYWMTWAITVPFFIGIISKGRTIKQTILEGYLFAIPGTLISFFIIPNNFIAKQIKGSFDFLGIYANNNNIYEVIGSEISTLPYRHFALAIISISMILFCATSYDSISLTLSCYSYKNLSPNDSPSKFVKQFWATLLALLPIAIIFANSNYNNIQNLAILAGFPAAIIVILVIISTIIDFNLYLKENDRQNS